LNLFVDQQRSENTKKAYQQDMLRWEKFLGSSTPSETIILAYRDFLESTLSNNSAVRAFNTIRSYFKWQGVEPNPFDRVKGPRRTANWTPVSPPDATIDHLMEVCTNPKERAIIALLANGLRAQEVCDLRTEDMTYEPAYDMWVLKVTGKGNKIRFVPLNRESSAALEMYHGDSNGRMFPKLNIRKIYYLVKEKYESGLNPHSLRHNYATRLIRSGVDVFSVQKLLGHERADTTGVYVNLDIGDLVRATQKDTRG
jgi:site-specific recombinase XerD